MPTYPGRASYGTSSYFLTPGVGAVDATLLAGETDGLAADFTSTTKYYPTWDVSADQWYARVQKRVSSVDTFLDPQTFFTNSGTSPKYVLSPTGIAWAPHNLCTQSQAFSSAAWNNSASSTRTDNTTAAPDGTVTAATLTMNASSASITATAISGVSGAIYTVSLYSKYNNNQWIVLSLASAAGTDRVRAWFDIQNGVAGGTVTAGSGVYIGSSITSVGSGWYRLTVTGSMTVTDQLITFRTVDLNNSLTAQNSSYGWGAQINNGISATEYMVTTSAAAIGLPVSYGQGLLVEPAATNNISHSQDFESGWTATRSSISTDVTTAPDGSSTADKLVEDTTASNSHGVGLTTAVSSVSAAVTTSVYVKPAGRTWVFIFDGQNASVAAYFNLSGVGSVGTQQVNNTSASIVSVGGGWYRCQIQFTSGGLVQPQVYLATADNTGSYTGDGSSGAYIWGLQNETGLVATSYIPTAASTVTRGEDDINVAISNFTPPWSTTVGTVYADSIPYIDAANTGGNSPRVVSFDDNTISQVIGLGRNTGGSLNNNRFKVINGGGSQCDISTQLWTTNVRGQITGAWQANNFGLTQDGGAVTDAASGSIPPVTSFKLGYADTTTTALWGPAAIRRFVYVPRRVPDGSLPTWRYNF